MAGLHNLGLTCAANALIQIIAHNSTLRTILLKTTAAVREDSLTGQLKDVVMKLHDGNVNNVVPVGFITKLYQTFTFISPHEQMDICELWMLVSSKIADETGTATGTATDKKKANSVHAIVDAAVARYNNDMCSEWLSAIQGIQLSVVKCEGCQDTPWNTEVVTTYELDIPAEKEKEKEKEITVSDMLLDRYSIERLKDWTCEKCKASSGALKQNKIYSLPAVLIIVIKRFCMSKNGHFFKKHSSINVQDNLVFEIDGQKQKNEYKLTGIGNHYGSYNGGHYNAHVLKSDGSWMCHDDSVVTEMSKNNASFLLNNQSAYLLCYERV